MFSGVFVIDGDEGWGRILARAMPGVEIFLDGVSAMAATSERVLKVVVMDLALRGPGGMAVLNEMASYIDLARVPVILLVQDMPKSDLSEYGVVAIYDKGKVDVREVIGKVGEIIGAGSVRERS